MALATPVDELDLQIIGALHDDGRRPIAAIARQINVPKSTVQRRLDALIRSRVVTIAPYADSTKVGLGIHAQLNLRVELLDYQDVLNAVTSLTEVRWVAVTTGPADIIAEAHFASPEHLHLFIKEKLATIKGISRVETSIVLSVEKITFEWDAICREAAAHNLAQASVGANPRPPADDVQPPAHAEPVTGPPEPHCRSPGNTTNRRT